MSNQVEFERVSFLDIYPKCMDKINKKISHEEFVEFLDNEIEVEKYISVSIKKSLSDLFFIVNSDDKDFVEMALMLEVHKVFGILFSYTNIQIKPSEILAENYDVVLHSGLYDYIRARCNNDFILACNLIDNALKFKCASIAEVFNDGYDVDNLKEIVESSGNMFKNIETDKLSNITNILEMNDPSMVKLRDEIYSSKIPRIIK